MKDPAVSVILPVYDPGDGIRKCIEMLLTQTLSDIELIFIDDCGSDASMDVVREFAKSDARIRILINSENLGAGASRNRGIEAAKGEYVAFVDPDDYPQKDFLSLLYRKTVKTKPDIVKGDRRLVSFDGKQTKEGNRISLNDEIRAGLEKGGKIYQLFSYEHWTAIYRREFLIENHIRYGLTRNSQDTTFLLRVGKAAKSILLEDRAIYCYVSRENSRMHDFTRSRLENELAAFGDIMEEMRSCDADHYSFYRYMIGKIHYELCIHTALLERDDCEADWFFRELKRQVSEFPQIEQFAEMSAVIRAFLVYDVNLTLRPYRAQGAEPSVEAYMKVMLRISGFLKEHPEVKNQYGWMLRVSYINVLNRAGDAKISRRERRNTYQYLRDLYRNLPGKEFVMKKSRLVRLFFKTGVNLIPAWQTLERNNRKLCLRAVSVYHAKRDRR